MQDRICYRGMTTVGAGAKSLLGEIRGRPVIKQVGVQNVERLANPPTLT